MSDYIQLKIVLQAEEACRYVLMEHGELFVPEELNIMVIMLHVPNLDFRGVVCSICAFLGTINHGTVIALVCI